MFKLIFSTLKTLFNFLPLQTLFNKQQNFHLILTMLIFSHEIKPQNAFNI